MEILSPYAKILIPTFDGGGQGEYLEGLLEHCEYMARISHRSEDRATHGSAEKLLEFIVMNKGDFSVIEHASLSVEMLVDRGITHEIVRHRLFSFTQESTRFCNYGKKSGGISVIKPSFKSMRNELKWEAAMKKIEETYLSLLTEEETPQIARSVLGNSLSSKIGITGNMRNWRHFLIMRTTKETHPQMKQVTEPLLADFKALPFFGFLYADIEFNQKQSEALKRMR